VGLILDLAVVAIAVVVVGSLALLTWTLGVSAVRSVRRTRQRFEASRRRVAEAESRLTAAAARATATLEQMNRRTRAAPIPTETLGEQPDA
jgi:hypothetical protein